MAEILIKAISATHSDPTIDRAGCYKRGYPVVVMPDGQAWGTEEGLPKFVVVKVPDATVDQLRAYIAAWKRVLEFTVDSSDLPSDTHTVTVRATAVSVSGEGAITRTMVENFLNRWGASVTTVTANAVTYTVKMLDAIESIGFWGRNPSAVGFTEVNYTQATGTHRVRADYSATPLTPAQAAAQVRGNGCTVVSHDTVAKLITFDVTRVVVRAQFEDDVRRKLSGFVARRRFAVTAAQMDAIAAAGGTVTRTFAQVQAAIHDQWTD